MIRDVRRTAAKLEPIVPRIRLRIAALAGASLLSGLAEAAVLVLIARIGAAVATGASEVTLIGDVDVSRGRAVALAAGAVVAKTALASITGVINARFSVAVLLRSRTAVIDARLRTEWEREATTALGTTQELLSTATQRVASWAGSIANFVVAIANLLVLTVIAVAVNPLAFAATACAGSLILVLRPLTAATRRASKQFGEANERLGTMVTDRAAAALEVRSYNVSRQVGDELKALSSATAAPMLRTRALANLGPHLYQGMALLILTAALAIISAFADGSAVEFGAVALLLLRSMSYGQQASSAHHGLAEATPFVDAVLATIASAPEEPTSTASGDMATPSALRFDAVSYAYPGGPAVLRDCSFELRDGEILGIVGPSGAGKSTLVQLLLGLRHSTSGAILVDGTPLHAVDRDAWAARVALVPQDPRLLSASVRQNIAFYRDATPAEVVAAATAAHIHDEITTWPDGYDTVVGERGRQVSGGQRQRIAIARALLKHPSILVLDEPTSALDAETEQGIRGVLAELKGRVTIVIVAHRPATLELCDRVMTLTAGRIVDLSPRAAWEERRGSEPVPDATSNGVACCARHGSSDSLAPR